MTDHNDPIARAFGPQIAQQRERRVHGTVTARVVRIEQDGTYRLRFHGMNGQDDDELSAPARAMTPMAGGGRGMSFLPEPGDEVVCSFQAGDTNIPIIMGAVWNGDDRPPSQAGAAHENHIRTIVSRAGHELTFDDTPGGGRVTLRSSSGHTIVLDEAPGGAKIRISSAQGRSVTLDDTVLGLRIETPTCRVQLNDAGGTLDIQATTAINLTAPTIALNTPNLIFGSTTGGLSVQTTGSDVTMRTALPLRVDTPQASIETRSGPLVLQGGGPTGTATEIDGVNFREHQHNLLASGETDRVQPPPGRP